MPQPSTPDPQTSADDCLLRLSTQLSADYLLHQDLPIGPGGELCYHATRLIDSLPCRILVTVHSSPLPPAELQQQQTWLVAMQATPIPGTSQLLTSHAEPWGYYHISSAAHPLSLRTQLDTGLSYTWKDIARHITSLAHTADSARAHGWPPLLISSTTLFSTPPHQAAPELALPPLPHHRSLTLTDTLHQLALLISEMLGHPQLTPSWIPLAALDHTANSLLAQAHSHQATSAPDARSFAAALWPRRDTTLSSATPLPDSAPTPPSIGSSLARPPAWPSTYQTTSLRLEPQTLAPHPPILITQAPRLTIGRALTAHCVTRFTPRTPRNDARTLLISREHLHLTVEGAHITARDTPDANPSYLHGQPSPVWTLHPGLQRLTVSGEYELDLNQTPSSWPHGQVWNDQPSGPSAFHGALTLSPAHTSGIIPFHTIWLHTDMPIGIHPDGTLHLHPEPQHIIAHLLSAHGLIALYPTTPSPPISLNGTPLSPASPTLLKAGDILQTTSVEYHLESGP